MLEKEKRAEYDNIEEENEFAIDQSKIRAKIRLREGRAKPIDLLVMYLDESCVFDIRLNELYMVFKGNS